MSATGPRSTEPGRVLDGRSDPAPPTGGSAGANGHRRGGHDDLTETLPTPVPGNEPVIVRLFGSRSFFRLWLGMLASSLGDWLGFLAIADLARRVGGDTSGALAVGFVFMARVVPGLLFGAVVGVLVDRWDRKRVMIVCDLGRAMVLVALPFVDSLPGLIVASLVMELLTLAWQPAKEASVPNLVPQSYLGTANSLSVMAAYGTFPVAAALFAVLAKFGESLSGGWFAEAFRLDVGSTLAFYVDATTFVLSAALIWTLTLPARHRRDVARAAAGSRRRPEHGSGTGVDRPQGGLVVHRLQPGGPGGQHRPGHRARRRRDARPARCDLHRPGARRWQRRLRALPHRARARRRRRRDRAVDHPAEAAQARGVQRSGADRRGVPVRGGVHHQPHPGRVPDLRPRRLRRHRLRVGVHAAPRERRRRPAGPYVLGAEHAGAPVPGRVLRRRPVPHPGVRPAVGPTVHRLQDLGVRRGDLRARHPHHAVAGLLDHDRCRPLGRPLAGPGDAPGPAAAAQGVADGGASVADRGAGSADGRASVGEPGGGGASDGEVPDPGLDDQRWADVEQGTGNR